MLVVVPVLESKGLYLCIFLSVDLQWACEKAVGESGRGNEFSPLTVFLGGAHKHKPYVDTKRESVRGNECLLLGARPLFVGNWKFQRVSRPQVCTTLICISKASSGFIFSLRVVVPRSQGVCMIWKEASLCSRSSGFVWGKWAAVQAMKRQARRRLGAGR